MSAGDEAAATTAASTTRSEERLAVRPSASRPYHRLRLRKVVHTEEITTVVTVRREELVIEEEPIDPTAVSLAQHGQIAAPLDLEMTLHREEFVVEKRVVPYERVHLSTVTVAEDWPVETELRREHVEIEREPLPTR